MPLSLNILVRKFRLCNLFDGIGRKHKIYSKKKFKWTQKSRQPQKLLRNIKFFKFFMSWQENIFLLNGKAFSEIFTSNVFLLNIQAFSSSMVGPQTHSFPFSPFIYVHVLV